MSLPEIGLSDPGWLIPDESCVQHLGHLKVSYYLLLKLANFDETLVLGQFLNSDSDKLISFDLAHLCQELQ